MSFEKKETKLIDTDFYFFPRSETLITDKRFLKKLLTNIIYLLIWYLVSLINNSKIYDASGILQKSVQLSNIKSYL